MSHSKLWKTTQTWRRVVFDFPTRVVFQRIDDTFARYGVSIDGKVRALKLSSDQDKQWNATFTYQRPCADRMTFDGSMDGHSVQIELKLMDRNQFLLVSRGLHWIQEYPFNR
ncbi:MAG TPA: hypothetical protein VGS27_35295 [Candidatus Sulfotelmatobacter sp.]|nr:hypothetical protein [Candidatus Sulfotelmatobacter sp.]